MFTLQRMRCWLDDGWVTVKRAKPRGHPFYTGTSSGRFLFEIDCFTRFFNKNKFYKNNEAQICPKIKNKLRPIEAARLPMPI